MSQTNNNGDNWIQLKPLPAPKAIISVFTKCNHEFAIISSIQNDSIDMYKYNVHSDEWNHFRLHFDDKLVFNQFHQKLRLLWNSTNTLTKTLVLMDLETHKFNTRTVDTGTLDISYETIVPTNSEVHLFGCENEETPIHMTWDYIANSFQKINDCPENFFAYTDFVFFIPSKNAILLMGDDNFEAMSLSQIWIYSLTSKTFTKMEYIQLLNCPCYGAATLLTSNGKFVIVAGGGDAYDDYDNIHIFELTNNEQYTSKESCISLPTAGYGYVGITCGGLMDGILLSGYIKIAYSVNMIPCDVTRLISKFYSREMFHWIGDSDGKHKRHYAIAVDILLDSHSLNI